MPVRRRCRAGDLAKVIGQGASVDLLIEDLAVELSERPYEIARVTEGWMLRTRRGSMHPPSGRPTDLGEQELDLREYRCRGPCRHRLSPADHP